MNNKEGRLHFSITADNEDVKRKLAETRQGIINSGKAAEEQGSKIEGMFKRAALAAGAFFTVQQAASFAKQIAVVRGEFQQLEVAFTTMLGSASKGKAMMQEAVEIAAKTPFDLKGVAQGAKQLLAYGSASQDVGKELVMLGNIAAGLSIPLNDMVYLYGTTQTQGRLFTQDLRQFMGRGIPLADELAKQFSVTKEQVGELVTAGKVGFPEVQKALQAMTADGGKFNNLMAEQSKTITGQISNLGDSIDVMFNKIGQSNEGFISSAISGATSLIENYEAVGREIGALVAAYGAYKAALIVASVYQKAMAATEMLRTLNQTTAALRRTTQAQILLNQAMGANPVAKVITLLMAAGTALYMFSDKAKTTKDIIADLDSSSNQYNKTVQSLSGSISRYDELQQRAKSDTGLTKDEHTELNSIMETMLATVPNLKGEFDEYGHILSVNIGIVKSFSKTQKEAYKDVLQDNIKTAEQEKKVLEDKLETQRKIFQEGKKLSYGSVQNGQFGGTTNFSSVVTASAEDIKLARGEWSRLNGELIEISASITNSKNTLDGINETLNDGDGGKKSPATPQMYGADYQAAQKEWDTAKKELTKIERDKDIFTRKQYDDAKKRLTDAEDTFSAIGGQTKVSTKEDKSQSDKFKNNQSKIEAERTLKDALVSVMFETEQAVIDATQNGYEREMAQIELNYRKKQVAIELWEREQRQIIIDSQKAIFIAKGGKEEDFKIDNNDAGFIPINKAYDAKSDANNIERVNAEKSMLDDLRHRWQAWGDEYQQIEDKLTEIANKAAKDRADIASAVSSGKLTEEQGAASAETVNKGEQTAVADLTSAKTKLSAEWMQVFRDLEGMSRQQVQVLIEEINAQLSNSELSAVDSSALLEQLNKAKEYSISLNPFTSLISGIEDVRLATDRLEQAKIKLEAVKTGGGSKQELAAATKEKIAAEKAVADAKKQRNDAASKSLGDTAGIAGATSGLLKSFGVESPAVDGVVNSLSALGEINFSNPISIITGGLKAVSSLLGGIFGEMDAVKERKIKEIQEQIDALEKSYDRLGKEVDKSYSSNASKMLGQQNEMLVQKKRLIDEQIREEASKKESDEGKIEAWRKAQEDIVKQQEENAIKATDVIFGSDIQSAISDFASAYMSAWAAGEDRAAAQKDVVKNMIKGIIQEMLKSDIEGHVEQMRNRIKGFMDDDTLSDDELAQIDSMGDEIGSIMEQRGKIYDKILKTDAVNENSLTGAIRGTIATEASVSELKGIMLRDSDNIHSINQKLDFGFKSIADIARHQAEIAANTRRTADNTDGLTSRIDDTNKKLDTVIKNTTPDNGKYK